ncbi:hypothetical protein ACHWQZ_G014208 [Mnemiopsis leidyi]
MQCLNEDLHVVMKLCNLLLYSVKEVELEDLRGHEGGLRQGIIDSLDMDINDKLYFYVKINNRLEVLPIDNPDANITDTSTIVVVDLLSLGQSSLNNYSFTRDDSVEEKHQALQCFQSFYNLLSDRKLLRELAISCRHNSFISGNLDNLDANIPVFHRLESASDLASREHPGQCDHLIAASKFFTHTTCHVLHSQILQLNWVELLDEGSCINVRVPITSSPESFLEISIHSDVFDECKTLSVSRSNLRLLGSGGFGNTFRYDPDTGSNSAISVVIKENKIQENKNAMPEDKPAWYREVVHTRQLCHDNIIRYLGKPILYKNSYFCLMEFGGESVSNKYYKKATMKRSDISTAMLHISRAIDYLHRKIGDTIVIHRDIRTSNVTVSDQNVYKLIDFGISSEKSPLDSKIQSDTNFGNCLWKSPEYCQYISGRKSDIWMFGVFTMEMMEFPELPAFFKDYIGYRFVSELAEERINLFAYLENQDQEENLNSILDVTRQCLNWSETERIDSEGLLYLCEKLQSS